MSLPVWLLGTKILPGGLCAWSHVLSKGSLFRGIYPGGSLSWGFLSRGLCQEDTKYGEEWAVLKCFLVLTELCEVICLS